MKGDSHWMKKLRLVSMKDIAAAAWLYYYQQVYFQTHNLHFITNEQCVLLCEKGWNISRYVVHVWNLNCCKEKVLPTEFIWATCLYEQRKFEFNGQTGQRFRRIYGIYSKSIKEKLKISPSFAQNLPKHLSCLGSPSGQLNHIYAWNKHIT